MRFLLLITYFYTIFGFNNIIFNHKTTCLSRNNVLKMESKTSSEISTSEPATTFMGCVQQAISASRLAFDEGTKLIEVEFPPLPIEYLEDSSSSARDIADANTRWAFEFAKNFADKGKITIIYPDKAELDDAVKYVDMEGGANPAPNITLATIRSDSIDNAQSLDQVISSIFGATFGGAANVKPIEDTTMYLALVSSTQELPDLEKLHELSPDVPIVFFNLGLDLLRGDLGLPLFPGRDLHHRFLSSIKPAYYLKSRSFATSLRRPPFIINYTGVLYRCYPNGYQSYLDTGDGKKKLCATTSNRPSNKSFRDSLTQNLVVPGVPSEELQTKGELVWWEKEDSEEKEVSMNWRS